MSKIMNWILKQQESGDMQEFQDEMDRLNEGWQVQDADPNAEAEAEKVLGRSEREFLESLDKVPF